MSARANRRIRTEQRCRDYRNFKNAEFQLDLRQRLFASLGVPDMVTRFDQDLIETIECKGRNHREKQACAAALIAHDLPTDPAFFVSISEFVPEIKLEEVCVAAVLNPQSEAADGDYAVNPASCKSIKLQYASPSLVEDALCSASSAETVVYFHNSGSVKNIARLDRPTELCMDRKHSFEWMPCYSEACWEWTDVFRDTDSDVGTGLRGALPSEICDQIESELTCKQKLVLSLRDGIPRAPCTIGMCSPSFKCDAIKTHPKLYAVKVGPRSRRCICESALFKNPRLIRNKYYQWALQHASVFPPRKFDPGPVAWISVSNA